MSEVIPFVVDEEVRWLIKELRLPDVPYWRAADLHARAALALERLISELEKKRTLRARFDLDYMSARYVPKEDLAKIIPERLLAKAFEAISENPDLYAISKTEMRDGSVRFELNLSIMPPKED